MKGIFISEENEEVELNFENKLLNILDHPESLKRIFNLIEI
ncbi:MAG: hypothetical protein CM15mP13_1330 [Pseudomonadota bacterium]|nr:MAG: hypothetical protein CM15mP13_1330 [Pseudomonadota bacterium]